MPTVQNSGHFYWVIHDVHGDALPLRYRSGIAQILEILIDLENISRIWHTAATEHVVNPLWLLLPGDDLSLRSERKYSP